MKHIVTFSVYFSHFQRASVPQFSNKVRENKFAAKVFRIFTSVRVCVYIYTFRVWYFFDFHLILIEKLTFTTWLSEENMKNTLKCLEVRSHTYAVLYVCTYPYVWLCAHACVCVMITWIMFILVKRKIYERKVKILIYCPAHAFTHCLVLFSWSFFRTNMQIHVHSLHVACTPVPTNLRRCSVLLSFMFRRTEFDYIVNEENENKQESFKIHQVNAFVYVIVFKTIMQLQTHRKLMNMYELKNDEKEINTKQ